MPFYQILADCICCEWALLHSGHPSSRFPSWSPLGNKGGSAECCSGNIDKTKQAANWSKSLWPQDIVCSSVSQNLDLRPVGGQASVEPWRGLVRPRGWRPARGWGVSSGPRRWGSTCLTLSSPWSTRSRCTETSGTRDRWGRITHWGEDKPLFHYCRAQVQVRWRSGEGQEGQSQVRSSSENSKSKILTWAIQ